MPEIDDIKDEVMSTVDSEIDAWNSFYKKFKKDYAKIGEYEKQIERLEAEIERRDSLFKKKMEEERGRLFLLTGGFVLVAAVFIRILLRSPSKELNLFGGFIIGLGAALVFLLWTK